MTTLSRLDILITVSFAILAGAIQMEGANANSARNANPDADMMT